MKTILSILLAPLVAVGLGLSFAPAADATGGGHEHPAICHAVGSATGGNQHNGYSLIHPSDASSHIDESLYPDGHYWKHEHGNRHDHYLADSAVEGVCGLKTDEPEQPPCGPEDVCNLPVAEGSKGDVVCDGLLSGGVYDTVTVRKGATCT